MATVNQVNALYSELLGRAPDAGGLQHYLRYDPTKARSEILGSAEYAKLQTTSRQTAENARNQQLTDYANQQKAQQEGLLNKQKAEEEGLFKNYENLRKSQEALPTLYNRLQNEAGIPQLGEQAQAFKNEIYSTKDKLDRLGEDIIARTTGYNVSDAQRRRLQTAEADPLQTNLGRLGTGLAPIADMLSSAQRGVETQLSLGVQQQDRELEPVKLRIDKISDRFAREITGFTADRELGLTTLLDKVQRQRELSDQEWALAQKLAQEERDYTKQKASASSSLTGFGTTTNAPAQTPAPTYIPLPTLPPTTLQKAQSGSLPGLSNYNTGGLQYYNTQTKGNSPALPPTTLQKAQSGGLLSNYNTGRTQTIPGLSF